MKKRVRGIIAMVLAAGMLIGAGAPAYGGLFGWGKPSTGSEKTDGNREKTEYSFQYKETQIKVDADASTILIALGTPEKIFEQDSCAYQGKDKIYTYPGFELGVYPVNGIDKVSSIYVTDDTVSTPEGIKIGSTVDDVIQAYGKDYQEQFGVYRFVLGNSELSIYTTNKVVDGIEYQIAQTK